MKTRPVLIAALILIPTTYAPLFAGTTDVVKVRVQCTHVCTFSVTLKHADTGWDHYADKWEVLAPDGTVIGTRVLYHPHVNEQPFTRSLSGVKIPEGINEVTVRGKDSVHGFGGIEKQVKLPDRTR
jgi:hypothetical protein